LRRLPSSRMSGLLWIQQLLKLVLTMGVEIAR
jgi:hypothetical protein